MRNIFNYLVVDMFPTSPRLRRTSSELYGSFSPAGGAHPSSFTGEGDKERVFATVAADPSSPVSENATIKVLIKGLGDFIPKDPILMLEP
jgi:hypothetical protein